MVRLVFLCGSRFKDKSGALLGERPLLVTDWGSGVPLRKNRPQYNEEEKMTRSFNSEAEIEAVVRGFESCTTAKDNFSHRDHITVAVWYLFQSPDEAASRMRASLHRFLDHNDCRPKYHETLTLFWIERASKTLKELPTGLSLLEATNAVIERIGNSRLVFDFYSKELVESAAARESWVEPDRKTL